MPYPPGRGDASIANLAVTESRFCPKNDKPIFSEADYGFLKSIIEGVVTDQGLIDRKVNECLGDNWTLARLDATARAILRAGGFEIMFRDDVPAKVAISEYVEVAKAFFGGSEPGFINAALDKLARERRPEEF